MGSYQKIPDLEALIRAHPLVESCVVVGDDEEYLSALISPCKAALEQALEQDEPGTYYRLSSYPVLNRIEVRAYYCDLLEQINTQANGKRIERFALVYFAPDKTREQICEEHRVLVESFYQEYIAGVG